MNDPKHIVREGYNVVSHAYRGDVPDSSVGKYTGWIDGLSNQLPKSAHVLELGCGCGVPATQLLVEHGFAVTGVDISDVQIQRAKKLVPEADFVCGDMCSLNFAAHSFAAIVSLYALIHVPLEEQPALLANVFTWLQPDGYLLAIVGAHAWTGTEQNWLDVDGGTMYWSHADKATYRRWLADVGFVVLWNRFIPEGNGGHTLLFAKKTA